MIATTITVISGFLGSGKTTLIKELLARSAFGASPILVENDYGTLGIDSVLLRKTGIVVEEVDSGCICCSVRGAFKAGVERILEEYQPRQLIVEPSGVGKLSNVLKELDKVTTSEGLIIKRILAITVVDASRFKFNDNYVSEYFWDQVKNSNMVVANRTESMAPKDRENVLKMVCEKTGYAPILSELTEDNLSYLKHYINSSNALIDNIMKETPSLVESRCEGGHDHEGECNHVHPLKSESQNKRGRTKKQRDSHKKHEHDFQSWSSQLTGQFNEKKLEGFNDILQDVNSMGQVMRAKGIFPGKDQYYLFDYIPGQGTIQEIGEQESGWVMVIGRSLKEENLKLLFAS